MRPIPGPRRLPGPGGWLTLARLAADPLGRLDALFLRYGNVVGLSVPVFSSDPLCKQTVFAYGASVLAQIEGDASTFHRTPLSGTLYPRAERPTGRRAALTEWATGLFALNGEEHRAQRKLMAGAFLPRRLEEHSAAISRIAEEAVGKLATVERADVHHFVGEITLKVATELFFGEQYGRESAIAIAGERSLRMVLSPAVVALPYDLRGLPYRRFLSSVCDFNREVHRIVKQRRSEGARGDDLLSGLVRAMSESSASLSESEVVGHASVIFAAGHETTSNAISWALFFLSQDEAWQEAVREELERVLGGAPPSLEDLDRLELLEMTILESLRLMPPAPWNSRTTTEDCLVSGVHVPSHTEVVGSIYHTHRDRDEWSRSSEFVPERWTEAEVPRSSFHPFGGGQHVCLGASFAMLEMKLVLAAVLQRLRLDLVDGARIDPLVNITMTFRNGLPMRIRSAGSQGERGRPRGEIGRFVRIPA